MQTQEEDVLVHKFDERLLREVLGAEGLPVDETEDTVDRLKLMLSFIGDVLAGQ
jgi:hypothetical protein